MIDSSLRSHILHEPPELFIDAHVIDFVCSSMVRWDPCRLVYVFLGEHGVIYNHFQWKSPAIFVPFFQFVWSYDIFISGVVNFDLGI